MPKQETTVKVKVTDPRGLTEDGTHYAKGATLEISAVRYLQLGRAAVVQEVKTRDIKPGEKSSKEA